MIRIERSACPACLSNAPSTGDRYRNRAVVAALWEMQRKKCCYSEMLIPEDGHGKAVEHFHPQSTFGWLRNEWGNLLLVCPQCNGKKSNQFPVMLTENENEAKVVYLQTPSGTVPAIIDPSDPSNDPEVHLTYVLDDRDPLYGQIIPRRKDGRESVLGRETISVTGIDDEYFLRARKRRAIQILSRSYCSMLNAQNNGDTEALEVELRAYGQFMGAREEFAGLAREYARDKRLDERFSLNIPGPGVP